MQLASGVFWLPGGVSQREQVSAFLRTIQHQESLKEEKRLR